MARAEVRIETNYRGIGDLLTSSEVQDMLNDKAEAVANAARSRGLMVEGVPGDVPLPVTTSAAGDGTRARAYVTIDHPSGLAVEAKHRLLAGSLDAAG